LEVIIGFFIAVAIAMTGVGAGTITAPMLILFLHMPLGQAVGTALIFGAGVKIFAAPVYWFRKQVNWRIFGLLVLGGLPGVILSSVWLTHVDTKRYQGILFALLGLMIALTAIKALVSFRQPEGMIPKDRSKYLAPIAFFIGAEVGFSSAGAGALGTSILMVLTPLTAAQIVGTDLFFGLALSIVGGGVHFAYGDYNSTTMIKLLIGGVVGALVGANTASLLPSKWLKYGLAAWLVYLGGQLIYRGVTQ
jgi:uncharacterized membrane protein YfcA